LQVSLQLTHWVFSLFMVKWSSIVSLSPTTYFHAEAKHFKFHCKIKVLALNLLCEVCANLIDFLRKSFFLKISSLQIKNTPTILFVIVTFLFITFFSSWWTFSKALIRMNSNLHFQGNCPFTIVCSRGQQERILQSQKKKHCSRYW